VVKFRQCFQPSGGAARDDFERKMACKICNRENLQKLDGELTASLPTPSGMNIPPIYVCQSLLVCLDCGFAELVIPPTELLSIKKAKTTAD
jgi:hypothetical protein